MKFKILISFAFLFILLFSPCMELFKTHLTAKSSSEEEQSENQSGNPSQIDQQEEEEIEHLISDLFDNQDLQSNNELNISNDTILLIAEKYLNSKNEYNKVIKEKEYLTMAGIGIVFTMALTIRLFRRQTNTIKNQLLEKEQTISSLQNSTQENPEYSDKSMQLYHILLQHLQLSKKIAMMNSIPHHKNEQLLLFLNEIMYGDPQSAFDWNEFLSLINLLYDNLLIKLQNNHPQLSFNDIQFCSLIQAGFDTGEIAFILKIQSSSVRMRKVSIRKKLGITDGCDLGLFFDQFLKNNTSS